MENLNTNLKLYISHLVYGTTTLRPLIMMMLMLIALKRTISNWKTTHFSLKKAKWGIYNLTRISVNSVNYHRLDKQGDQICIVYGQIYRFKVE